MKEICGAPMRYQGKRCARPEGHKGRHYSEEALERRRESNRERARQWRESPENRERQREYIREYFTRSESREKRRERDARPESRERKRASDREYYKTPNGRESYRRAGRRRRAIKAGIVEEQITRAELLARDSGHCYICGCELTLDAMHVEHVIPLNDDSDLVRYLRAACKPCNSSKQDTPPAEFVLRRWKAGLPVRQAPVVTCAGCPILALAA